MWPMDTSFISLDPDADHLAEYLPDTFDRVPVVHEAGLRLIFDGPESFTPTTATSLAKRRACPAVAVSGGLRSRR